MVTSALIPPTLVRPIAVICGLIGCHFIITGLYDLFVDHDTTEMFTRGIRTLITREADADRFHAMVFYRIVLGAVMFVLAGVLDRLWRWKEDY
jgi:hypothetical protein